MSSTQLPRRAVLGAVLAASIVGGGVVAFAAGEGGGLGLPTKECNTITDPKGDGNVGSQEGLPGSFPNDPDLDITGLVFGSNDKALTAYLRLDKLADRSQYGDGHAFSVNFTANGKAVVYTTFRFAAGQVNDGMASLPDPLTIRSSYVKVAGSSTAVPFTATYDTTNSMVILSADRAGLEKAIGGPIATISKIGAESDTDIADLGETADLAEGKDATWTADSNACFGGAAPAPVTAPSAAPPSAEPAPAPAPAPAAGGGDPSKLPNADCSLAKDPKGDASIKLNASAPGLPNDPDLDLTAMTLGSDDKNLYAYLKLDKLAAGPAVHDGHRFYVNFTFNKHNFTAAGSTYKNASSASLKDGLAQTGQVAHVTQLAVDGVSSATDPDRFIGAGTGFVASGLKYVFDVKTSTVTAILPIADIEKYGKAPVAGAVFSSVYGGAYGDAFAVANPADAIPDGATTPATSKVTWTAGDNACFGAAAPAASPLSSVGAVKAQYGDTAAVAAKLVDAAGAPVTGKTVTFTLGSSKVTGTTGADGVAKGALVVNEKAGKRSLVITSDDAKSSVDFTVSAEKTALKATGGKGGVTATLTDDDKKPVAGQVVTFTSGSKKVTAKTDAKGVAKATGLPPGNIKVAYAGASGMYTAASTTTKA